MKVFFALILLYYFLGLEQLLQLSTRVGDQTLAWIHIVVITGVALLYYHCKTHPRSRDQLVQLWKNIYQWLRKIVNRYLFVATLIVFVLAAASQLFWPIAGGYVGWFLAVWVLCAIIAWDAFWDDKIYMRNTMFLHKDTIFWFSVGLTFLVAYRLRACTDLYPLVAVLGGMIVYILAIKQTNIIQGYSIWKLFGTRVYAIALVGAALAGLSVYTNISIQQGVIQLGDKTSSIASGLWDRTTQAIAVITEDIQDDVDVIVSTEETLAIGVIESAPESEDIVIDEEPIQEVVEVSTGDLQVDPEQQVTFTQALTHIFDIYNVGLSTATNIRFTNIATSDPRYALFKTAHEKRLLGATINPDAPVRCDVYMVMQGIVAGWSVSSQGDVFDKYRAAATANNAINGCTRNGMLKVGNL